MLELKDNKIITNISISKNSPIIEFQGELKNVPFNEHDLQIGNNLYLKPTGGLIDYIRHNCNPNSYLYIIGKRVFLYSIWEIKAGKEITYDWSLSSTEDPTTWEMNCNCGMFCRKTVSGYETLPAEVKKKYLDLKIVPLYLTDQRFKI
jgi:SET domain-containing protein